MSATRREFIANLASGTATCALPVRARATEVARHIGVLIPIVQQTIQRPLRTFLERLDTFGWRENHNLRIDYRWPAENAAQILSDAEDIVALKPDVIMAHGGLVVTALQKITRAIPVVFVQAPDPVEAGFVKSLAHPGGNLTGFTNFEPLMASKWLEILKEIAPNISRVILMLNPQIVSSARYLDVIKTAAEKVKVLVSGAEVHDPTGIAFSVRAFANEKNGGLIVLPSPVSTNYSKLIIELCSECSLPAIYPFRFFAEKGGLQSYGSDTGDMYERAAAYVDQILRGANAANLPVQEPTKFELVINRKTAKALGLIVPPTLLTTADEVIE